MSALTYIAIALWIFVVLVLGAPWVFDRLCPRAEPQTYDPDEHENIEQGRG